MLAIINLISNLDKTILDFLLKFINKQYFLYIFRFKYISKHCHLLHKSKTPFKNIYIRFNFFCKNFFIIKKNCLFFSFSIS